MINAGEIKFEPRSTAFTRDDVNQINKAFELIVQNINGLTPTTPKTSATSAPNGQVNLGGTESSGFFVPNDQPVSTTTPSKASTTTSKTAMLASSQATVAAAITKPNLNAGAVNVKGGSPGNPPIGPSAPSGTVQTDGSTISGNGQSQPLSLVVPVTIPDGGTGLIQAATQQITTHGTLIAAGTAQAQPALTLTGVTTTSAASWSLPNTPDATWQTGIMVILVCTSNTVTPYLVNPTAAGITPIAQAINIKVIL